MAASSSSTTLPTAGRLHFALRRADDVHWLAIEVGNAGPAALKGQGPCVVRFTGLSGSGTSTIANILERKLHISDGTLPCSTGTTCVIV